jgi:hypothetical protein
VVGVLAPLGDWRKDWRNGALAFGGAEPADRTSRLAAVRVVFTAYLLLITVALAFYIAIGITNHQ